MKLRCLFLIGVLSASAFAAEPLTLTLDQALTIARQKTVDLALARLDLEEFHSRYRQAVGNALPQVALSGSYTRNFIHPVAFFFGGKLDAAIDNGVDAAVDVQQPLYTGGKVLSGIRAAKAALGAQEEQVQNTENEVVFSVKNLFYNALLSSATVGIEGDNLASAQNHLDTIQSRYGQGLDSDLTVRRQKVEVANARAVLIGAKNAHEMALISLQEILTLDVDRPLRVSGTLDPPQEAGPSYEAAVRLALARHPGLKAARQQVQFYDQIVTIAAADFQPQLALFGHYEWVAQSNAFSPNASERGTAFAGGLRLNYPLFTGGDRLEKVRQARINRDRTLQEQYRLERAVRVDVRRQWLDIREALERARSQEEAIDQARRALEATEIRYKAGRASQLELNDATFALNRVRTLYILAAHDYWVSRAALEKAAGGSLQGVQP